MDVIAKRVRFLLGDLQQLIVSEPGVDRVFFLSILDAYRSLILLNDNFNNCLKKGK